MKNRKIYTAAAALALVGTGATAVATPASAAQSATVAPSAAASVAPASQDVKPVGSEFSQQVAQKVLQKMNAARAQAGLAPLSANTNLDNLSAGWSSSMAGGGGATHNPSFIEQTTATGSSSMAENIAYSVGSQGDADATAEYFVNFWLNSPSHAANIMNPQFNAAGFGLAQGEDGNIYATQNFGSY